MENHSSNAIISTCLPWLVLFTLSACDSMPLPESAALPVTLVEIGILEEIGIREQSEPLALFHFVNDAAFVGNRLAVLDESPPFVRFFGHGGDYLGSGVIQGDGPGEARRPLAISSWGDSSLIVSEAHRTHLITNRGEPIGSEANAGRFIRGSARVCSDRLARLVMARGAFEPPGAVTLGYGLTGRGEDTVATLGSIRSNGRRSHPVFVANRDSSFVMYSEEVDRSRLLEVHCKDASVHFLPVDSLGPQERFEMHDDGTQSLHPAAPPLPAGLATIANRTVWGVQQIATLRNRQDSVTVFTLIGDGSSARHLAVHGWFQILDTAPDGRVALGTQEPVAHVAIIDGNELVEMIIARGTDSTQHYGEDS